MIRLVLYFLLIAAAAWGLSWIADRPGNLTFEWLGLHGETTAFIAIIVLAIFFAAFSLAVWLGILTWTAPNRIARRLRERHERIGQEAVRRGIFAAGAGDKLAAAKAGAIAKKHVPGEPLALLLEAQSAQLNEDPIASRQAFERMLDKPEMAELGLRGLFIEAKKAGQAEAAKQFAGRALTANPALSWPSSALFDIQCREGDWRAALRTLGLAKQHRHISKTEAGRRRALLLTQLAIELEDTEQGKALAYAQEAISLLPSLTPASTVAGRILASQGNSARAAKLLAEAWRTAQHPEIALIYAHARIGDSPRDRLARVKALIASGPASLEGDIAVAVAAIEAKEWAAARLALEPYLRNTPPARVCRLMARIEAGQNRDLGRAREWLAKAGRGAPDPVWVAPDGTVSLDWHAVSPASGALGAFEWKTPPAPAAGNMDDILAEVPEAGAISFEPEATFHAPQMPGAGGITGEIAGPAQANLPRLASDSAVLVPEVQVLRNGAASMDDSSTDNEPGAAKPEEEKPADAGLDAPKAGAAGKPKANLRRPNIFVPGPAPDDPGPRPPEADEASTPLSRFRRPT
jgi:HemY protein